VQADQVLDQGETDAEPAAGAIRISARRSSVACGCSDPDRIVLAEASSSSRWRAASASARAVRSAASSWTRSVTS